MRDESMDSTMDTLISQIIDGKDPAYRTTEVNKDIDPNIDLGNLLSCDPNPLDTSRLRSKRSDYLIELARDNVQLLVNKLWQLPSERVEDAIVVKTEENMLCTKYVSSKHNLPDGATRIPREKPVPKPKEKTKWEQFAAMKGIQNKKKGRMVYDEQSKDWKPRWGYKRANDDTKEWMIPVPENADPMEDQFEKRLKAKKERVAKNELQRLRNLARNMKGKVPGVGLTPTDNPDKSHLNRALQAARTSNASMGRFTKELKEEKGTSLGNVGKKRKFEPNIDKSGSEKKRALDILSKIRGSQPIVDKEKAAQLQTVSFGSRTEGGDGKKHKSGGKKHSGGKGRPGGGGFNKGQHAQGGPGKNGPVKAGGGQFKNKKSGNSSKNKKRS